MNYYEHHLGDYLRDTAHLSMLEDGAYRRLIDAYYVREKPLPTELRDIYRLVRAGSKQDREAVETVLREFFRESADGWRHSRCDREIERYSAGEPEREVKRANETNRLKKHREERAKLFKAITDAGHHAAWNASMTELREVVKRLTAPTAETQPATGPETLQHPLPATAPATPATATQTPYPDTIPIPREKTERGAAKRGTRIPEGWVPGDPGMAFAAQQGLSNGRAAAEVEKFRDHWSAKTGQDATKADWQAAWRNWVRRSIEFGPSKADAALFDTDGVH